MYQKKSIIRGIIMWKYTGKWEVAANSYMHNSNCDLGLLTGSHPPGTKTSAPTVNKNGNATMPVDELTKENHLTTVNSHLLIIKHKEV